MRYVNGVALFVLIAIFLFSAIDKVAHYDGFVNALRSYVLVPRGMAPYFAVPIVLVELVIGVGLLLPAWRRHAALTGAITLALFTAALGIDSLFGGRSICGCWFTLTLAQGTGMHILQNLLLCLLLLDVWWRNRAPPRQRRDNERRARDVRASIYGA